MVKGMKGSLGWDVQALLFPLKALFVSYHDENITALKVLSFRHSGGQFGQRVTACRRRSSHAGPAHRPVYRLAMSLGSRAPL